LVFSRLDGQRFKEKPNLTMQEFDLPIGLGRSVAALVGAIQVDGLDVVIRASFTT